MWPAWLFGTDATLEVGGSVGGAASAATGVMGVGPAKRGGAVAGSGDGSDGGGIAGIAGIDGIVPGIAPGIIPGIVMGDIIPGPEDALDVLSSAPKVQTANFSGSTLHACQPSFGINTDGPIARGTLEAKAAGTGGRPDSIPHTTPGEEPFTPSPARTTLGGMGGMLCML